MASKKLKLLFAGVFILLATVSFAQKGTYTIYDSSVVPASHMAQQNEFWNNTYDFPAKPRSQTEVGISGGMLNINGRVPARMFPHSWGGALHLRKSLGYLLSLRLQAEYGVAQGQDWGASYGWANNTAWRNNGYTIGNPVFYNYRTKIQNYELQGILSLNNILFHKAKTGFLLYAGAGGGVTLYHAMINALGSDGKPYTDLFNGITADQQTYANRKATRDYLLGKMDKTFETDAETRGATRQKPHSNTMLPSASLIGGMQFKLSKRVNIAIEDKLTVTHDDYLDGQAWQEHSTLDNPALAGPHETYNYVSVGFNFNIGNKRKTVEPLYWINPLNYAYSEINNPKHMKIPPPVLPDSDNDGVIDQLDQCPNTPAGAHVDTHGCPLDTDGDGVPDYKDKELITPTYCQPVDADGVGKCPPPACCKEMSDRMDSLGTGKGKCAIGDLPSISFKGKATTTLSKDQRMMLASVASKLKANSGCSIIITGHPMTSKASQNICNKRVDAIKKYLIEKEGISSDRITTSCEPSDTGNDTVDISGK